jgi:hypothetical protein
LVIKCAIGGLFVNDLKKTGEGDSKTVCRIGKTKAYFFIYPRVADRRVVQSMKSKADQRDRLLQFCLSSKTCFDNIESHYQLGKSPHSLLLLDVPWETTLWKFCHKAENPKKSKEDITKKDGTYALTKLLKESTE